MDARRRALDWDFVLAFGHGKRFLSTAPRGAARLDEIEIGGDAGERVPRAAGNELKRQLRRFPQIGNCRTGSVGVEVRLLQEIAFMDVSGVRLGESISGLTGCIFARRLRTQNSSFEHSGFKDLRINPRKSGMKYEDSEVVTMQLIDETVQLRWKQVRCQLILLLRAKLGLRLNPEMFVALLEEYKQLEEQFVDFVGMENGTYQQTLIDRLGLGDWSITRGGAS